MTFRSWTAALAAAALGLSGLAFAPGADAGSPIDELAVSVVGDGVASGNVAVPVQIHYVDGTGTQTRPATQLPVTATGDNRAFTLGADRDQQGALQQSADRNHITIGGYAHEPGEVNLNSSTAPEILRSIALIAADGTVDTSTTLAGAFSERHIRGVVTHDGSYFWAGGHGNDAEEAWQGALVGIERGGDEPTAIRSGSNNNNNNGRVPGIHNGQLYLTTDREIYDGLNRVGDGLPISAVTMDVVASTAEGPTVAHDFAFVGESLYINYTDGDMGIVKFAQRNGGWEPVDRHPGEYWGLTGRVADDVHLLYATKGSTQGNELVSIIDSGDSNSFEALETVISVADPGFAYRGVDFAPGFTPGTAPVEPPAAVPAISWDVRVQGGSGGFLSAVLGQVTQPTATGTVLDPEGRPVQLTATSEDQNILADADITLVRHDDGTFELSAAPSAEGRTVIHVTALTDDGTEGTARLVYWVSGELSEPSARAHTGMSDASAAADAGDGHFFAIDDDSNAIRLFGPDSQEPLAHFSFESEIGMIQPGQAFDSEGMTRAGNTIYVTGSLGNSRSGNVRLDRDVIYAVDVTGAGAEAQLSFRAATRGVRAGLVAWDAADGHGLGAHHFGFERATAEGYSAEGPDSLNVEGLAMSPNGELWLGFRSPVINGAAVMVPILNIVELADADYAPAFGDPVFLDLGGRAIRDLVTAGDGNLLIMAGSADDAGDFALYGWDWDLDSGPVPASTPLGLTGYPGSYEGAHRVTSLVDGTAIRVLLDTGTVDLYGDGTQAQDLPAAELRKFFTHDAILDFDGAFTTGGDPDGVDDGRDDPAVPVAPGLPDTGV